MTTDSTVGEINAFTDMARTGFFQFVIILVGVTFIFWTGRILVSLFKRHRKKRQMKNKKMRSVAKNADPNKWETDWELSERARKHHAAMLTPDEQRERRKQLEEDRETYRINRRNNQWEK